MPTKFKPSSNRTDRRTGVTTTEHFYMKSMSKEILLKELNATNLTPKLKQKINKELIRRNTL